MYLHVRGVFVKFVDNLNVKPIFKLYHFKGFSLYVTSTLNNWRTLADREHNGRHGNVPSIYGALWTTKQMSLLYINYPVVQLIAPTSLLHRAGVTFCSLPVQKLIRPSSCWGAGSILDSDPNIVSSCIFSAKMRIFVKYTIKNKVAV